MTTARVIKTIIEGDKLIVHRRTSKIESAKIIEDYLKSVVTTPQTQYRRIEIKPRLRHYPIIEESQEKLRTKI